MPTCWIIAGPNVAGKTTFALEYLPSAEMSRLRVAERPELVFRQQAGQCEIYHSEFFELLQ
jgi:hypothetical protein